MFTQNVGSIDRVLRGALGIFLIALAVFGEGMVWGWIGVVPLATAAVSFCPAYRLIGLNTCGRQ